MQIGAKAAAFSIFVVYLQLTINKLPSGLELIYRTNGKLFNSHYLHLRTKVSLSI